MRRTAGALCALLAMGAAAVQAQEPPKRAHHAAIYDAARGRVLVTGGSSPYADGSCCAFFDDVWTFDGRAWSQQAPSGFAQSGQRLAADPRSGAIYSFGGYSGGRSLGHLIRYDGTSWEKVGELPDRPTAEGGLVFDARRGRLVLFGGSGGRGQVHGDTWEYDGTQWSRAAAEGPPGLQAFAMAYDTLRDRTVLFGGMGATPQALNGETWEYDGARWVRVAGDGPSARMAPGFTYDTKRGLFLVFGGSDSTGMLRDLWAWDGRSWRLLANDGPDARAMGALVYDLVRDRVVLFGGRRGWPDDLNDTWEWDGTRWSRVR